jgi:hypothetical protein
VDPGTWAQWAGAAATTTGIIVALFRESIYGMFHHPDLEVRLAASRPFLRKDPVLEFIPIFCEALDCQ